MFSIHVGIDRGILVCLITAFNFKILRRPNFMLSHSHGGSGRFYDPSPSVPYSVYFWGQYPCFVGATFRNQLPLTPADYVHNPCLIVCLLHTFRGSISTPYLFSPYHLQQNTIIAVRDQIMPLSSTPWCFLCEISSVNNEKLRRCRPELFPKL